MADELTPATPSLPPSRMIKDIGYITHACAPIVGIVGVIIIIATGHGVEMKDVIMSMLTGSFGVMVGSAAARGTS